MRSGAGEGWLADEHFVRHAGQTIEIALCIELALRGRLLGTHVRGRAKCDSSVREILAARFNDGACDAEIGDDRVSTLEEDVFGLDVAMQDSTRMRMHERVRHFPCDSKCLVHVELRLPAKPIAQCPALGVRHDVLQESASATGSPIARSRRQHLTRVEEWKYVGGVSLAVIRASRRKRSAPIAEPNSGLSTFRATLRSCRRSCAR